MKDVEDIPNTHLFFAEMLRVLYEAASYHALTPPKLSKHDVLT